MVGVVAGSMLRATLPLLFAGWLAPAGVGGGVDLKATAARFDRYIEALRAEPGSGAPLLRELTDTVDAVLGQCTLTQCGVEWETLQGLRLIFIKHDADFGAQVAASQALYEPASAPLMLSFAQLLERSARHSACVSHFNSAAIYQQRCSTVQYSNALLLLKRCGQPEAAQQMFARAVEWSAQINASAPIGCASTQPLRSLPQTKEAGTCGWR